MEETQYFALGILTILFLNAVITYKQAYYKCSTNLQMLHLELDRLPSIDRCKFLRDEIFCRIRAYSGIFLNMCIIKYII